MRFWHQLSGRSRETLSVIVLSGFLTLLFCLTPVYKYAELTFFDLRLKHWSNDQSRNLSPMMLYSLRDSTRQTDFSDLELLHLFTILESAGVKKIVVFHPSVFQNYQAVKSRLPSVVQVFDEESLQLSEVRDRLFLDDQSLEPFLDADGSLRGLPWSHPAVEWSRENFRIAQRTEVEPRGPRLLLKPPARDSAEAGGQKAGGDSSLEYLYGQVMEIPEERRGTVLDFFRGRVVVIERATTEASDFAEVSTADGELTAGQVHLRLQQSLADRWTVEPVNPVIFVLISLFLVAGFCNLLSGREPATVAGWGFLSVGFLSYYSDKILSLGVNGPVLALLVNLFIAVSLLIFFAMLRGSQALKNFGGAEDAEFAGEETEATMVFTNLPPYLLEMERNHDEDLLRFRRDYNEILAQIAERYHGKVLDYQGDAQMLGFGLRHDDDTEHAAEATSAALEIVEGVAGLAQRWKAEQEQFRVHAGVCTGTIALGHLGADQKQDIAAIGDTTNTAARLMGAAMKSKVPVLISKPTYLCADGVISGSERPPVDLKGKSALVEVYSVEGVDPEWQAQNRVKDKDFSPTGGTVEFRGQRKNDLVITFVLGFVGFLVALSIWRDGVLDGAELKLQDVLHRAVALADADPRIILVGIDEDSMNDAALGSFPWSRGVYGQAIKNLEDSGHRGFFIDVMFKSPRVGDEAGDEYFAKMLAADPRTVIAGVLHGNEAARLADPQVFPAADFELLRKRHQIGLIHSAKDDDGIARSGFLAASETASQPTEQAHLRRLYPSAASALILQPGDEFRLDGDKVVLGKRSIATRNSGEGRRSIPIRFGPPSTAEGKPPEKGSYELISFRRLLDPSDPIFKELQGKYLFAGQTLTTGEGNDIDRISTVVGSIKGVEVHARLFDNLLNDNHIVEMSLTWRRLMLWVVGILTVLILTRYRETKAYLAGLAVLASGLCLFHLVLFSVFGVLGELLISWATVGLVSAAVLVGRYVLTFRALARVVPAEVARELLLHHSVKDRRQTATILLTDIRGYTTLSEGRTAVAMLDVLNEYHKRTVACYDRYGGQALTYQGDAQIVVFGVFGNRPNPAADAVAAALGLQAICDDLREEWGIESREDFDVGAGLCTGEVEVGLLGGAANLQYSVVGETVRKAHKVQSLSADLNAPVILDEETFTATQGKVEVDDLGLVQPKGIPHEIRLFKAKAVLP